MITGKALGTVIVMRLLIRVPGPAGDSIEGRDTDERWPAVSDHPTTRRKQFLTNPDRGWPIHWPATVVPGSDGRSAGPGGKEPLTNLVEP